MIDQLTQEQIHEIQEEFRKFQHYPTLLAMAAKYQLSIDDVLAVINKNPRIGAFLYQNSVYTWRHVRQFEFLIKNETMPNADVFRMFGLGSKAGVDLMYRKVKQLAEIEKRGYENVEIPPEPSTLKPYELTEHDKQVIEYTKQGMTQKQISEKIGVSKSVVQKLQNRMKKLGYIATGWRAPKEIKEEVKQMVELDERAKKVLELKLEGMSNREIGVAVGIGKTTAQRITVKLRELGLLPATEKPVKAEKVKEEAKPAEQKEETVAEESKEKTPDMSRKNHNEEAEGLYTDKIIIKGKRDGVPENEKETPIRENKERSHKIEKIERVERIDKLAEELVKKLHISRSAVGRALSAARNAIEYAFNFGEVNEYTINGDDTEVTISLHGDGYDLALHKSL